MIIIILSILLILSILNTYYIYYYNYNFKCPLNYFYNNNLPHNIKFKTITFFYKNDLYKKCHKNDFNLDNTPIRNNFEMKLNHMIKTLGNDFVYIENKKNKPFLLPNEQQFIKIKNL
jgi:hypothetical protein